MKDIEEKGKVEELDDTGIEEEIDIEKEDIIEEDIGEEGGDEGDLAEEDEEDEGEGEEDPEEDLEEISAGYSDYRDQCKAVSASLKGLGLDARALSEEYFGGGLSEETYQTLEKAGYKDRAIIDLFCSNISAKTQYYQNMIVEAAGGKEAWNGLSNYLKNKPNMRNRINKILGSDDLLLQIKTIKELAAKADIKAPTKPAEPAEKTPQRTIVGTSKPKVKTTGFKDRAALRAIEKDPRFGKDPEFMKGYYTRLSETEWLKRHVSH